MSRTLALRLFGISLVVFRFPRSLLILVAMMTSASTASTFLTPSTFRLLLIS